MRLAAVAFATLPISPALEWPDSANGSNGTLPAAGASKVTIRK